MKYVLKNDIWLLKNKYKKYFFLYYIVILLYFLTIFINKIQIDNILVAKMLGVYYKDTNFFLDSIIFVFNFSFNIFIVFILFENDIKNGICNIFFRISLLKWIIYKILSSFIILFFKSTILIILFSLLNIFLNLKVKLDIFMLLKSLILLFNINLLFIITFSFKKGYREILILIISVLFLIQIIKTNVYNIDFIFMIFSMILEVLIILCRNSKYKLMFENG